MGPSMKKKTTTRSDDPFSERIHLSSSDKCCGILHGGGVLVQELKDISSLVHLGCYGKGIFSRSVPTHHCLPQLHELVRSSKRKRQSTSADAGVSSSAAESSSEWIEKLKCFEEAEIKRFELHSQWKREKERLTLPLKKQMDPTPAGQEPSGHKTSSECDSRIEEDIENPAKLSTMEKTHHDFIQRIKELRRTDPFPVKEHLQLSSEEATYLATELNVLQVTSPDRSIVNTETLWSHFLDIDSCFVERYTAYRYYRSKGWVPKSGLKFGVDFLLYKEGPSFYHSTYAVVVALIEHTETNLESVASPPQSGLSWRKVIALDRVNEAAGKELVVCYVVKPPSLSQEDLKLPTCIASLQVRELFIKRWVPERERQ